MRSARNMSQGRGLNLKKCCQSCAWKRCISAKDVCISLVQVVQVRSLQSQLHNVNGRSASGDRINLPLPSMSEALEINTVLLSAKCSGTVPPSEKSSVSIEEEFRTETPTGAESFFIAMSSSNSVLSMIQRMSSGAF